MRVRLSGSEVKLILSSRLIERSRRDCRAQLLDNRLISPLKQFQRFKYRLIYVLIRLQELSIPPYAYAERKVVTTQISWL